MEKFYRFAGVELSVSVPEQWDYQDDKTLSPFRVDAAADPHRFSFRMVKSLSPPEGQPLAVLPDYAVYGHQDAQVRYISAIDGDWQTATMRCLHQGKDHPVQLRQDVFPRGMTAKTLLNACATEHLVARAGGFVFHTSFVQWQDRAILFTAPSGTGKSTQAELWRSLRGAEIINGDRAVVRVDGGRVLAEGLPFAGSSQICKNRSLPLAAIVYLSQAPVTTICRLRGAQAFARVWEGISVNVWDRQDVAAVSDTAEQLVRHVPVYHLACTPDETAVAALEQLLGK